MGGDCVCGDVAQAVWRKGQKTTTTTSTTMKKEKDMKQTKNAHSVRPYTIIIIIITATNHTRVLQAGLSFPFSRLLFFLRLTRVLGMNFTHRLILCLFQNIEGFQQYCSITSTASLAVFFFSLPSNVIPFKIVDRLEWIRFDDNVH